MQSASRLPERICGEAENDGYDWVEGCPVLNARSAVAFTGPAALYRKTWFTEYARLGSTAVIRK